MRVRGLRAVEVFVKLVEHISLFGMRQNTSILTAKL